MDPLALYAAVVATGALAWQVWTWLHRARVRCDVRAGLYGVLGPPDEYGNKPQAGVLVEVVNRGEHPVRVTHAAFKKQGGGPDQWLVSMATWGSDRLPLAIPAATRRASCSIAGY